MCETKTSKVILTLTFLAMISGSIKAAEDVSSVFFGKDMSRQNWQTHYKDFSSQGRFFSTSDYGFAPGSEYTLTGKNYGVTYGATFHAFYTRGQDLAAGRKFVGPYIGVKQPWVSDGGPCLFGLTFEKPLTPMLREFVAGPSQFDQFKDNVPLFDQVVISWGERVPRKGTWGCCLQDANGKFKKIKVDNQQQIFPYSATTIKFPPTTVKTFYVGVEASGDDKNFVEVRHMAIHLYNENRLDNRLVVWQMDAYQAAYSIDKPGTLLGIHVANSFFPRNSGRFMVNDCLVTDLAPFFEIGGRRFYASKGCYPVKIESKGRRYTLKYDLNYSLTDKKIASLHVEAVFDVTLKNTISFRFEIADLPKDGKLGFEMFSKKQFFKEYIDKSADAVVVNVDPDTTFTTPAGPLGVSLEDSERLVINTCGGKVRFDMFADDDEMKVALSLPMGPEAGIQPGMIDYNWRPSLADSGDKGLAPFCEDDLDLLETIDLADPKDPHEVYDISNDPIIIDWRESGEKKLPGAYGLLNFVNEPEKGKVPVKKIFGRNCRTINNLESTYFRFNLKTRFNPLVPYLIVVEHAFDKERVGEFHCLPLDKTGKKYKHDGSLWPNPVPFGGLATGKAPYSNTFQKESVFAFRPFNSPATPEDTVLSLCFSNVLCWNKASKYEPYGRKKPEGPAIGKIWIYRVKRMPRLPDMSKLLPKDKQRHVVYAAETTSPWFFCELPKLYGYNTIVTNKQMPGMLLHGAYCDVSRPCMSFHSSSLLGQKWLFEEAARKGLYEKIFFASLLELGLEGTDNAGCFKNFATYNGGVHSSVPLSPTSEEREIIAKAIDNSLSVLAPYESFYAISIMAAPHFFFTKRNLDDFSRETDIPYESSLLTHENIRRLLDSDRKTVDAWIKWSCQKRFEFLSWLLSEVRKYRSDIYLILNHGWHENWMLAAYYGPVKIYSNFERSKLEKVGINNFYDFLKFTCHDPSLYAGNNGFALDLQGEETGLNSANDYKWPAPFKQKWFPEIRDSFDGGIVIHDAQFDESRKPFLPWSCTYAKERRRFRSDMIEALLYANAREFFMETYHLDPFRGRLDDLRLFAVPFQLLPYAKPETYKGKVSDTAKQAVIKKYDNRYGLMNAGDKSTVVTLSLPKGMRKVFDLSNGIRQELLTTKSVSGENQVKMNMTQWTLKTLEME